MKTKPNATLTRHTMTDKALLGRVPLALATLALATGALALWATSVVLGVMGLIPAPLAVLGAALGAYVSFTPMHDAAHRAVGRSRTLNAVVGRLAAVPLMGPFQAFRYMHLEHHKHTNEADGSDPDRYSGSGRWWLLPLRWVTQDLHYYVVYAGRLRRRPRAEAIEVVATIVALYGTAIGLIIAGYGADVALYVLLPPRIAITFLALAFDYLPHAPYAATRKEDRFAATRIIDHAWLTPVMLGQNYHLVHHLYPAVPWYRYGRVWSARRDQLTADGARAVRLWPARSQDMTDSCLSIPSAQDDQ
jgi:beta-carotene hydroxylase